MSISSEITRISNAKTAIAESITNKGVTVPSGTKIDGMAALIDSIQTGGSGTAVQPSKALTVTSNGTTTITPDAPYDAIKQVDLTVNVASGGGGGVETVTLKVVAAGIPMWSYHAFATGIDGVFEITNFGTYDVVKNSMFFLNGGVMSKTNLTELYNFNGYKLYEVTGDAQIKVS